MAHGQKLASGLVSIIAIAGMLLWTKREPLELPLEETATPQVELPRAAPGAFSSVIVSYDPLIIYLENFLSEEEASYIKDLA